MAISSSKEIKILKEETQLEPRERGFMTKPLSERGVPKIMVYLLSIVGLVYMLNPTAGIIELIPDVTPFVGNLDEGGAFLLLWYGLLEFFEGRRRR
ncbi:MAG: hypothetical protein AAF902_26470 [Chloroflexota bacterium]